MNTEEKKYATWREIKEQLNNVPDELLDETAMWWGDERGGKINSLLILPEDYGHFGEGYEPVSAYEDSEYDDEPDHLLPKGTPVIDVD